MALEENFNFKAKIKRSIYFPKKTFFVKIPLEKSEEIFARSEK